MTAQGLREQLAAALRAALPEVEHRLQQALRHLSVNDSEHALRQMGISDGGRIVEDYLQHGEAEVAFDHLLCMIREPGLALSAACIAHISIAAGILRVADSAWNDIELDADQRPPLGTST